MPALFGHFMRCGLVACVVLCPLLAEESSSRETAQAAFDVGIATLPRHFTGNTVDWVLRFGTLAPRTSLEPFADYVARRRAFRSEVFAFVLDKHELQYNRTNETMLVTIQPALTRVESKPGHFFNAIDVHRTRLSARSHAGPSQWTREQRPIASERNAVLSTKREWKQTQLVVADQPLAFALKMPRDRVRKTNAALRVAVVCMPDFEQFAPAGHPAMRDATGVEVQVDGSGQFPDETITYYIALRTTLLQVWLFNRSTGEVYGRYTPAGAIVPRD